MGQIILRLDRVMADRKMSLNDLAEKVGVSNVNLSKMKNGKISAIRFSTLVAVCEALDCQPGDILEYKHFWTVLFKYPNIKLIKVFVRKI